MSAELRRNDRPVATLGTSMRSPLLLASIVCTLVLSVPAHAQDPAQPADQRIAPGVFAGGVDLGNLTIAEATRRLSDALDAKLLLPVEVGVAGRTYKLLPKGTKFSFDAERTAKRAYYAGRNNPPGVSQGGGAAAALNVDLAVRFRRKVVKQFVRAIDREVYIAPRDAKLKITLRRMIKRRSKYGRDLDATALAKQVEQTLADPAKPRALRGKRKRVRAKINTNDLARTYGTVLTIDKSSFRLRLFKRLRLVKSYGVAIGQPAYPTPSGLFRIQNKQVNPAWSVPNSPWAGELQGTTVQGGSAANPLKARWMGIVNGVGIHGTGQEYSIGSRASHGCLRMRVADVIALYPRVPVGAPVLIR